MNKEEALQIRIEDLTEECKGIRSTYHGIVDELREALSCAFEWVPVNETELRAEIRALCRLD